MFSIVLEKILGIILGRHIRYWQLMAWYRADDAFFSPYRQTSRVSSTEWLRWRRDAGCVWGSEPRGGSSPDGLGCAGEAVYSGGPADRGLASRAQAEIQSVWAAFIHRQRMHHDDDTQRALLHGSCACQCQCGQRLSAPFPPKIT